MARPLDRDHFGTWLLVEPSAPYVHDEGWVVFASPNPILIVVPDSGHWVAATSHTGAKVDLCSGISVGPDHVEFVDIELDVVWRWGDPARLEDLDDFHALSLPEEEAARYLLEADSIRVAVDAGHEPFGATFRQRLIDLTGPCDPRLQSTWAGAVGPFLVEEVSQLVGDEWIAKQRSGAGWLLCGGSARVAAVVWLDGHGGTRLLTAAETPEGKWFAMGSFLMSLAPSLTSFSAPALADS